MKTAHAVFIIHQVNVSGCFWLTFDHHFRINNPSTRAENSQNILSSWITDLDACKDPLNAAAPLSVLNLRYNRKKSCGCSPVMTDWHEALAEYEISGTSSAVLKGKVHHWKPHHCFCELCAVGNTSSTHTQTFTGLILSVITSVRPSRSRQKLLALMPDICD